MAVVTSTELHYAELGLFYYVYIDVGIEATSLHPQCRYDTTVLRCMTIYWYTVVLRISGVKARSVN